MFLLIYIYSEVALWSEGVLGVSLSVAFCKLLVVCSYIDLLKTSVVLPGVK